MLIDQGLGKVSDFKYNFKKVKNKMQTGNSPK